MFAPYSSSFNITCFELFVAVAVNCLRVWQGVQGKRRKKQTEQQKERILVSIKCVSRSISLK